MKSGDILPSNLLKFSSLHLLSILLFKLCDSSSEKNNEDNRIKLQITVIHKKKNFCSYSPQKELF